MVTKEHVLETLKKYRRTHVAWASFLKRCPKFDDAYVGDVEHHEKCVRDYDEMIDYVERQQ